MNRLVLRPYSIALAALVAGAISVTASAGGKSRTCHQCGHEKEVKPVFRLVKVCEEIDLPSYVYAKEDVFFPDKGSVCYTGYRCDTFYDFWRTCDGPKAGDVSQQAEQHGLPRLHCSSSTVCGCRTSYGAKSTGCHSGCSIRVPGKTQRVATPILKWEAVSLCEDCCGKDRKTK